MTGSKKWAEYLLKKDVKRLMIELKKKWISYGRLTGSVTLNHVSDIEKRDIEGITGKHYQNDKVVILAKDFEKALVTNRIFGEVDIKEVLDLYFDEDILTSKEKTLFKKDEDNNFFCSLEKIIKENNLDEKIKEWLIYSFSNNNTGYRVLKRLRKENPEKVITIYTNVVKGIHRILREKDLYLTIAVFASEISGNPHFLDRNTGDGATLFVSILSFLYEIDYPKNAQSWYELFEKANLIKDEISGCVAIYNVHLMRQKEMHKAAEECYKYSQVFMVSLANLLEVTKASSDNNIVYVVENEMVFSSIQNEIKNTNIGLICSSGQLSITALKIIELLVQGNTAIYYSGDIDPGGLGICDRLWKKYPNHIIPWFMNKESYYECMSNENISEARLTALSKIENPILKETSAVLNKERKAGYQENIINDYIKDIKKRKD